MVRCPACWRHPLALARHACQRANPSPHSESEQLKEWAPASAAAPLAVPLGESPSLDVSSLPQGRPELSTLGLSSGVHAEASEGVVYHVIPAAVPAVLADLHAKSALWCNQATTLQHLGPGGCTTSTFAASHLPPDLSLIHI